MFDIPLRPLKDTLTNPLCALIPHSITPLHLTLLAFLSGLLSCLFISLPSYSNHSSTTLPLALWLLNRTLDSLDGALARHRGTISELGGFLDLWCDFIVYSLLPIAVAWGHGAAADGGIGKIGAGGEGKWLAVAVLEATFHVNNFVLFYVAALVAKLAAMEGKKQDRKEEGKRVKKDGHGGKGEVKDRKKELTSVSMRPALIEGFESGVLFTLMLIFPSAIEGLSWLMAGLVAVGIGQRTVWVVGALW
ncbi:MAG: hypothetical protein Q9221_006488 [Calogaya cf. arnoldii]